MSARSPRRTFAASFVVTLAAAPACVTTPPPPPNNPPGPTEPIAAGPEVRDHRADPAGPTGPEVRDHRGDPGPTENPPPPPPPPPPDAPPTAGERRWVLQMHDGKCSTRANANCPKPEPGKPMRTCNPPAPQPYTCPTGMTDGTTLAIVQWAGASDCVIPPPPVSCPKGAMCNPPPPRKVACPR